MITFDKIKEHLRQYKELQDYIAKLINYTSTAEIIDCRGINWTLLGDSELGIGWDGEDPEEYHYTISSFGAKGEELFKGKDEELTYIMAYVDDWNEACIYVFDNDKEIIQENI